MLLCGSKEAVANIMSVNDVCVVLIGEEEIKLGSNTRTCVI